MYKLKVTKKIDNVKITLTSEGKEPLYQQEHKMTMIEELLDSYVYDEIQAKDVISRIRKEDIKLTETQQLLSKLDNYKFPVKIPSQLKYLYCNDDLPF